MGTLVAFVGDTPAVNMVGGFKEGVGMAMRKCRHCMATFSQIQTKVHWLTIDFRAACMVAIYNTLVCGGIISDEI